MSHAYQQILMDDDSKKYLTVNTHRGLFKYNRLPFGVASAPAIFQRTMEGLLKGIPLVAVYLDDILVSGVDVADHLKKPGPSGDKVGRGWAALTWGTEWMPRDFTQWRKK